MNKLRTIAYLGLRGRKRQTLLMISAISLSIAFITTILNMQESILTTAEEARKNLYGEWHAVVYNIDDNAAEKLSSNLIVDTSGVSCVYSAVADKDGAPVGHLGTMDENAVSLGRLQLLEGRLPTNKDEIAIETSMLDELGISYNVGEEITLNIQETENQQFKTTTVQKTFVLSGVISNYTSFWKNNNNDLVSAIVSHDYIQAPENVTYKNVFFTVKPKYFEHINSLNLLLYSRGNFLINDNTYFALNPEYSSFDEKLSETIISLIIIFIASVFIIFNVFHITFQKRRSSLILLRTVGANKRQIAGVVFHELVYIVLFAFPIGLGLGALFSFVAYMVLKSSSMVTLLDLYNLGNYLLAMGITLVSLFIGAAFPVTVLIRSSLRQSGKKIKLRKKPQKIKKMSKSKILSQIQHPGLRSKILTAILPVLTFIVIMLALSNCFMKYSDKNQLLYHVADYEFGYLGGFVERTGFILPEKIVEKIQHTVGIESVDAFRITKYYPISFEGKEESEYQRLFSKYSVTLWNTYYHEPVCVIHGIDPDKDSYSFYESQIQRGKIDLEKFRTGEEVILYLPTLIMREEKRELINPDVVLGDVESIKGRKIKEESISPGDTITIRGNNGDVSVKVGGIIYQFTIEDIRGDIGKPFSIISSYALTDKTISPTMVDGYQYVQVKANKDANSYRTDKELAAIDTTLSFYNRRAEKEKLENEANLNTILSLTLMLSIYVISIMLQINALYNSFETIRHKLGVLRILGISKRDYMKYSLLYTMVINILSVIAGLSASVIFLSYQGNYLDMLGMGMKIGLFFIIIGYLSVSLLLAYLPNRILLKNNIAILIKNQSLVT